MTKKLVLLIVALAIAVAAWTGISRYREAHNTPEAAMAAFVTDVSKSDAAKTYDRFSDNLQAHYKSADWQKYVTSLGQTGELPKFVSSSTVTDRFNTYPANSNPHRFVYDMQVKGRQYRLTTVILKQDNAWKIDDLQGSYK